MLREIRADTSGLVSPRSRAIEVEHDIIGESPQGSHLSTKFVNTFVCRLDKELITKCGDKCHAGKVQTEIAVGGGPLLELQTVQTLVAPGNTCLVGTQFLQIPETAGKRTLTGIAAHNIAAARTVRTTDGESRIDLGHLLVEGSLIGQCLFWSQCLVCQGFGVEVTRTSCCHG